MRIFIEQAEQYIQSLAAAIGRDPASLETWRCIHIHPSEDSTPAPDRSALLKAMQVEYNGVDCDVVFCCDQDILLIGRAPSLNILHQMQEALTGHYPEDAKPEISVHDLFFGWRDIRKILLAKVEGNAVSTPHNDDADFGEVASLQEVFRHAKAVRKARNPLHILLVEDDEMTRRLASSLFKDRYAVITAKNAQDALAAYLMHAPDIVFLDINLPDHNGFTVLKQILASDADAYVVMFSGNSYLDNITHAIGAGASGFVAKPFSKEKMRHYIEDCEFGRQGSQG